MAGCSVVGTTVGSCEGRKLGHGVETIVGDHEGAVFGTIVTIDGISAELEVGIMVG